MILREENVKVKYEARRLTSITLGGSTQDIVAVAQLVDDWPRQGVVSWSEGGKPLEREENPTVCDVAEPTDL